LSKEVERAFGRGRSSVRVTRGGDYRGIIRGQESSSRNKKTSFGQGGKLSGGAAVTSNHITGGKSKEVQ